VTTKTDNDSRPDFEKRRRQRHIETPDERHQRHQAMEAVTVLDALEHEYKDPPEAMRYFYDLFKQVYCEGEPVHQGRKAIGTMCIQAPYEIIHALGGVPVRLCNGFHVDEQTGSDFMPAKSCSLVKATIGMLHGNHTPTVDELEMVVNLTTCDQKTKAGAMIAEMGYQVYDMELPRIKDSEEGREYWRRSVRKFTKSLSKHTGKKLSRKNLKAAITRVGQAQHAFHRLERLRRETPSPILGKDMFLVTNAFFFDDLERWTDAVVQLGNEISRRSQQGFNAAGRRSPRVIYTGSPPIFPNLKLPMMIEQADAVIVADETCSANRLLNDRVAVDEWFLYDMVDAVADRYLKGCTCPIFSHNEDRKRRLIDLVRTYQADGVVYQAFAGCQVYEMEQRSIMQALEKENIPMLYVETDYSPSHSGQLSTRIEAFIESLKSRRRKG